MMLMLISWDFHVPFTFVIMSTGAVVITVKEDDSAKGFNLEPLFLALSFPQHIAFHSRIDMLFLMTIITAPLCFTIVN